MVKQMACNSYRVIYELYHKTQSGIDMADDQHLQDLLSQMGAEARADFREPQYAFAQMLHATGGEISFVRNWLARGTITLDANANRAGHKHRRFSYRDTIIIALAVELSRQGIAPSNAERASEIVSVLIEERVGSILNASTSRSTVRLDFSTSPPIIASPDGPSVGVVIDINRLQDRVARALSLRFVAGTAEDLLRVAAEMEASGDEGGDEGHAK